MRINTNIASLNAQRTLASTGADAAKTIGRLSSGFRINKAADDAAGLGIANQLRADIRSLKQASRNAEQATSMLQIAEGAAQTVGSIVDRMKELATQAASDNVDVKGRESIKGEWDALQSEISRIVDTTKFQGGHLLKEVSAQSARAAGEFGSTPVSVGVSSGTANASTVTVSGTYSGAGSSLYIQRNAAGDGWEYSQDGTNYSTYTSGTAVNGVTFTIVDGATAAAANTVFSVAVPSAQDAVEASGGARSFLVSSSGEYTSHDLVNLSGLDLTADALGLDALSFTGNGGSAGEWRAALSTLDDAISHISGELAKIGAAQNRIEFATSNVKMTVENMSAAESTIRDADMAAEMSTFTKQQILQQAGVAMLAQANSAPQQILRLLQ